MPRRQPSSRRITRSGASGRGPAAARRAGLELRLAQDRRRGDAAPSPEAAVLAREPRAALLAAVNELSDNDRIVIALRYLLELSEAETAEILGCPQGTVKSRLARALGRLREVMAVNETQGGSAASD